MAGSFHKTKSVKRSKQRRCFPFGQQVVVFPGIRVATDFAVSSGQRELEEGVGLWSGLPRRLPACLNFANRISHMATIRMGRIQIGIINKLPYRQSRLQRTEITTTEPDITQGSRKT